MTFKFSNAAKTKALAIRDDKTIANIAWTGEEWAVHLKPGVEFAEEGETKMLQAFTTWLESQERSADFSPPPQPAPTPEQIPPSPAPPLSPSLPALPVPAPTPDPVAGTTGAEYLAWAAEHATEAQLVDLYAKRWKYAPFRAWCAATVPTFAARLKDWPH